MSNKTFTLSDSLYGYLLDNSLREPEVLRRLREETARHPQSFMQDVSEEFTAAARGNSGLQPPVACRPANLSLIGTIGDGLTLAVKMS
ncbi:MAG TPA: hypothetical protein VFB20_08470 [Burkholderiales bacterium]|nr:hypothetical protein [Burkholderiales bacterium]